MTGIAKHPALAAPYRAVKVIEEAEVPTEVLASAIVTIAEGVKKLRSGRLSDRALFILIQDATPGSIGIREIKAVLDGIENLKRYVRK